MSSQRLLRCSEYPLDIICCSENTERKRRRAARRICCRKKRKLPKTKHGIDIPLEDSIGIACGVYEGIECDVSSRGGSGGVGDGLFRVLSRCPVTPNHAA